MVRLVVGACDDGYGSSDGGARVRSEEVLTQKEEEEGEAAGALGSKEKIMMRSAGERKGKRGLGLG